MFSIRYYWEALRTSYWFLPAILGLSAIVLSLVTVGIDHEIHKQSAWNVPWTYSGGPEGARAVLATIAGSMITVAGVVFSITIVALSLASAQFGPRSEGALSCRSAADRAPRSRRRQGTGA